MLTNCGRYVLVYYIINIEPVGIWQGCIANERMKPIFSCIREAKSCSKLEKVQQEPPSKIAQQTLNTGIYRSAVHSIAGYFWWFWTPRKEESENSWELVSEVLIVKGKDPVHLSQEYMNLVLSFYFGMFPNADQWNKDIKDFLNVTA